MNDMIDASISNIDIFSGMDYWHEIVERYDSMALGKKNDGTYSQSSVVILLIYLTFGSDHPYNIMKFFKKSYRPIDPRAEIPYLSSLNSPKIYTMLLKMEEDGLVTVAQNKARVNPKKTYSINPRVIQSPVRDGVYIKHDGSTFEIPLELIEQFLPWRDLQREEQKDWSGRDGFFRHVVYPEIIDYYFFIEVLFTLAEQQNLDNGTEPGPFEELLEKYYDEIKDYDYQKGKLRYVNPFKKKT
jgi:hypothetical protein